eukprot:4210498-Pyramimonas_sp.AAC.1
MRAQPLGPSVELPVGPRSVCGKHAGAAAGRSVEPPYGATKRVRNVPTSVWGEHAGAAAGAVGGTPPKRVKGVPK